MQECWFLPSSFLSLALTSWKRLQGEGGNDPVALGSGVLSSTYHPFFPGETIFPSFLGIFCSKMPWYLFNKCRNEWGSTWVWVIQIVFKHLVLIILRVWYELTYLILTRALWGWVGYYHFHLKDKQTDTEHRLV